MPIANSELMAITTPKDADRRQIGTLIGIAPNPHLALMLFT